MSARTRRLLTLAVLGGTVLIAIIGAVFDRL